VHKGLFKFNYTIINLSLLLVGTSARHKLYSRNSYLYFHDILTS